MGITTPKIPLLLLLHQDFTFSMSPSLSYYFVIHLDMMFLSFFRSFVLCFCLFRLPPFIMTHLTPIETDWRGFKWNEILYYVRSLGVAPARAIRRHQFTWIHWQKVERNHYGRIRICIRWHCEKCKLNRIRWACKNVNKMKRGVHALTLILKLTFNDPKTYCSDACYRIITMF